ncbi:caspase-8 [Dunckerocampus dactyliophorus]|uniref:caspase-8 n=1 Tax=Dunckerocampus dactyliophorus TaxID=161453 RepID=UPI002405F36A|nr:caspase-8 [Dunckerocampus dactyliophorus]XP_054624710.1 caspase-8 [Dunckerocampus dactyliophorus]
MERRTLMQIAEELESSEVATLCFLCRDVVNKKRLEGIEDAKELFYRLEERGLLENCEFLAQLLDTINRADLLSLLGTNRQCMEETDAKPILSNYRVMLYHLYDDITKMNLERIKFLLSNKIGRRQMEECKTALDVFVEMEKVALLSNTSLDELHSILLEVDVQLASQVQKYINEARPAGCIMDYQHANNVPLVSISETQPSYERGHISSDAETNKSNFLSDQQEDYYAMSHNPHGLCVIINNEEFSGPELKKRSGTQVDEKALRSVFSELGFTVKVYSNLTAEEIRQTLIILAARDFSDEDAVVVCLLSHGEKGCVFGTDEKTVSIRELTLPFTSGCAPTLAGKPKLFFIQACQGAGYQKGSLPCPQKPKEEGEDKPSRLEEDAGPIHGETVPSDADFLFGMATVPECRSFRNTSTGSIYIQELCKQLRLSAKSPGEEDIHSILTRVNREVSRGVYQKHKQMPQPNYTLTKKLVFKFVDAGQVELS